MLKQLFSRIKMVFAILLAVLFVTSLSAVTVEAHGWGHGWGWGGPWWGSWGYGPGCMWVGGNNWLCPAYSGMPYTIQTTAPTAPAPAPDAPQPSLAGVVTSSDTTSKDSGDSGAAKDSGASEAAPK